MLSTDLNLALTKRTEKGNNIAIFNLVTIVDLGTTIHYSDLSSVAQNNITPSRLHPSISIKRFLES